MKGRMWFVDIDMSVWNGREEVIEVWKKLHRDELHNYYFFSNIIRMIKSKSMRGAGHMKFWLENRT